MCVHFESACLGNSIVVNDVAISQQKASSGKLDKIMSLTVLAAADSTLAQKALRSVSKRGGKKHCSPGGVSLDSPICCSVYNIILLEVATPSAKVMLMKIEDC